MGENLKRTDLINAIEETRKSFDTDNPTVPFIEGDGIGTVSYTHLRAHETG